MATRSRLEPIHAFQAAVLDVVVFVGLAIICLMEGQSLRRMGICLRVGACCALGVLLLGAPTDRSLMLGSGAALLTAFTGIPSVLRQASAALLVAGLCAWTLGLGPLPLFAP